MGDPVGTVAHIKSIMKPDGTFMLVEPLAGDTPEDNFHPLGAIFYAFSTMASSTMTMLCSWLSSTGYAVDRRTDLSRLTP